MNARVYVEGSLLRLYTIYCKKNRFIFLSRLHYSFAYTIRNQVRLCNGFGYVYVYIECMCVCLYVCMYVPLYLSLSARVWVCVCVSICERIVDFNESLWNYDKGNNINIAVKRLIRSCVVAA